jgi:hypothetical protein
MSLLLKICHSLQSNHFGQSTEEVDVHHLIQDAEGVIPRDAPLILHDDTTTLEWSSKQRTYFRMHVLISFDSNFHKSSVLS